MLSGSEAGHSEVHTLCKMFIFHEKTTIVAEVQPEVCTKSRDEPQGSSEAHQSQRRGWKQQSALTGVRGHPHSCLSFLRTLFPESTEPFLPFLILLSPRFSLGLFLRFQWRVSE